MRCPSVLAHSPRAEMENASAKGEAVSARFCVMGSNPDRIGSYTKEPRDEVILQAETFPVCSSVRPKR
jgi:hypothetical protein